MMIQKFILILMLLISSENLFSQEERALKFDDYKVTEIFSGKPHSPDFENNEKAKKYRSAITKSVKSGVNFAGHYSIVIWGCGTSCQDFAIVDLNNGKIYFPEELHYVTWGDWWEKDYGLKFVPESNLLIVYGRCEEKDPKGIFYFVWKDNKLRLAKSVTVK